MKTPPQAPAALTTLQDLKLLPQWVCFTLPDKKPINPHTGYGAKANDPKTWGTYEIARQAWKDNKYAGIGFEFVQEQCLVGVDLDKCVDKDGTVSDFALMIISTLNSYTEYSPSGRGFHIWVHGSIPSTMVQDATLTDDSGNLLDIAKVEMYQRGHYFTVTGNRYEGTPATFEDRSTELLQLHAEITEQRRQAKKTLTKNVPVANITITPLDTPYGLKALQDECDEMASTGEGGRNQKLNEIAFRLGQLVGGNELSRATVEQELYSAAVQTGLDDREIAKTMQSGLEAGIKEPRKKPDEAIFTGPALKKKIEAAKDLCKFSPDDAGNGEAMHALFGGKILYCEALGWMHYTGTHWRIDESSSFLMKCAIKTLRTRRHAAVDEQVESIIKATVPNTNRINGTIACFRPHVATSISEFDCDEHLLNCRNGVVNLKTGEVTPHDASQRFTYCVPVDYKPADATIWTDYLNGVVGGGQEMIDYLQLAIGYSLTGSTREECLFYVYGPSRSGKGTVAEILMKLLPHPLSTMVDFNSFTAKREGDVSNFDLAELKPSRVVFASESQRNQQLNPAKIKQLTGGDQVRACFKHKNFFSYRPQFKVWMLSNWPCNGDPEDDALWGRVRVIQFPNSYLGREDKGKKQHLKSEQVLTSILYWSVQGAMKWYALGSSGLQTPAYVAKTTKDQREELDFVKQWLDECTKSGGDVWTSHTDAMKSYTDWCEANSVTPKKARALSQSLQFRGFETNVQKKIKGKNAKGIRGLTINQPDSDLYDGSIFEKVTEKVTVTQVTDETGKFENLNLIGNFPDSPVTSVTGYQSVTSEQKGDDTPLQSERIII